MQTAGLEAVASTCEPVIPAADAIVVPVIAPPTIEIAVIIAELPKPMAPATSSPHVLLDALIVKAFTADPVMAPPAMDVPVMV